MNMNKAWIGLVWLCLCTLPVWGDLSFQDAYTNEPLANMVVTANHNNQEKVAFMQNHLEYAELGNVSFILDNPKTEGNDYAITTVLTEGQEIVTILPCASIRGIVKDRLDNVVKEADIKFECQTNNGFTMTLQSDRFGDFQHETLPTGSCRIHALYKNAVGSVDVSLAPGSLEDIEITLDKTIVSEEKTFPWGVALGVLIVAAIGGTLLYTQKKQFAQTPASVPVDKAREDYSTRKEDIISTLSSKQQQIVRFLLEQEKYTANQSKIRWETGIPRTSLTRALQALEQKKIISLTKVGKMVRITVTPWFLGEKDQKNTEKGEMDDE